MKEQREVKAMITRVFVGEKEAGLNPLCLMSILAKAL
jgi:hypothetical protein